MRFLTLKPVLPGGRPGEWRYAVKEANQKPIGLKRSNRFKSPAVLMLVLLAGMLAGSVGAAVTLPGHVPAAVSSLTSLGALPATNQLRLAISLPLRNPTALAALLKQIYDPASTNYHHYLTPAQFTAQFGPTPADYQKVADFAQSNGLAVVGRYPNRLILDVTANVSNINKAFKVTLRTYNHPKEARTFYAPDVNPSVAATLPILHISGLDNYSLPHPMSHFVPAGQTPGNSPKAGTGPSGSYLGTDFRKAYVPGTSLTGAGQNVGLLQFDGFYASDIAAYKTLIGMGGGPQVVTVPVDGGVATPGGGNVEVCLDIEMILAMAPGVSKIYVYEAPNPSPWVDLLNAMVANTTINQFSCSWGGGGPDPAAELIFQQMAAQGQSFYNASGDSCAFDPTTNPVQFPSESTNITQVGGTTLTTGVNAAYASEKVWNWGLLDPINYDGVGSCGGISPDYGIPYWQTNISMVANGGSTIMRNIPDVALTADNVYITADNGSEGTVGGTSCAAPLWAAFTALINQQAAVTAIPTMGFINPALYSIASGTNYNACFYDTTNGDNTWSGSTNNFYAVPGYDLCTGLGTPNGINLINALAPLPVWVGGTNTSGPPNDNFLNAVPITGLAGTLSSTNDGATMEDNIPPPSEPDFINADDYAGVDKSVWYAWTAPASGTVTFDTFGSGFDTVLAVYLPIPGTTYLVAANDDYLTGIIPQSRVTFKAEAGITYFISVNGNASPAAGWSDEGAFLLNWNEIVPTISSGTFIFSKTIAAANGAGPDYIVSDNESAVLSGSSWLGARVTVVRTNGFSGRVEVPYTVTGDATQPAASANGVLTFDDYQMSADIFVPITLLNADVNGGANPAGITITLGTPVLDSLESADLMPPAADPTPATIVVNSATYPVPQNPAPTNGYTPFFNFERATYRTTEGAVSIVIGVTVSQSPPSGHVYTVKYDIDLYAEAAPLANNVFDLQAGSDYATRVVDYTDVAGGTLTFHPLPAPQTLPITIPIINDSLVEFNEDMEIELYNPQDPTTSPPTPLALGQVNTAALTILFDDQPAGAVDRTWNMEGTTVSVPPFLTYPGTSGGVVDGANGNGGTVYAAVEQPNGKAIFAGSFNLYDSNPYNHIVRVGANGYPDFTFLAWPNSGANEYIDALALYPASSTNFGKILIGGNFTAFNGTSRYRIARLNVDGSVDGTFNPGLGVDAVVRSLALQTNGQVVIAGNFSTVNGTNMTGVARLNPDGSLDTGFNPGAGPNGEVNAVAVDAAGRVIIGGGFDHVAGVVRGGVARLNVDGTVDTTFDPGIGTYNRVKGSTDPVKSLALQADGRLLIGGSFAYVQMIGINGIARFNLDGTLDTAFGAVGSLNGTYNPLTGKVDTVNVITLQPDGSILLGGDFMNMNQARRAGIARLYADGSLDTSFMDTAYNQFAGIVNHYYNPDAVNTNDFPMGNHRNAVNTIAVEPGTTNVIIGGSFLVVGGGSSDHSAWRSTINDPVTGDGVAADGRQDVHPRSNVARLIGGGTPGPGNIEFCNFNIAPSTYTVGKADSSLYLSLTRTNGNLGIAGAILAAPPGPAGQPGIATAGTDYTFTNSNPTWPTAWPDNNIPGDLGWMYGDGLSGPNYLIAAGNSKPGVGPGVVMAILNNGNITGNLNANLTLAQPTPFMFYLGGELIPLGASVGVQQTATMTIVDPNFKAGTFSFSSSTYTVNESASTVTITVTRTNGTHGAVQVSYVTGNGTATSPANYTSVFGTLSFGNGDTSKTFTVPIIPSTANQPDKTVNLFLYGITGGGKAGLTNAVLTIVNNQFGAGHIAFAFATNGVNETAGRVGLVLNRMGASGGTLDVTAITSDGSAVKGVNYAATTNTVHWNDQDALPKTNFIPILHDGIFTPNLAFNVRLTNGLAGGHANSFVLGLSVITNTTVVVTNVDFPGTVEFTAGTYSVKKSGSYALIPVIRTGGSAGTVTVGYSTVDGSAVSGVNYAATNGVLTFTNGVVSQYFQVPIIGPATSGLVSLNLVLTNAAVVGNPLPWVAQGSPSNAVLNIIDTDTVNEPPGGVDVTYSPFAGCNGDVYGLVLQTNNQLLVAGDYTMVNGVPRQRIARLNADGSLDNSFSLPTSAMGAGDQIRALAVQSDGRIVVGGYFTNFNSVVMKRIARLNYDGSLDSQFNPGSGADSPVYAVAETFVNGDRKIVVGGGFSLLNGRVVNGIGRLNDDGTPDTAFNAGGLGANGTVYALAVYPTNSPFAGRVVIGGDFTQVNGINAGHIARLNADGSMDPTFTNASASDSVRVIAIQPDGQILAGGLFTSVNGNTNFNHIARLNSADGSADSSFTPGLGANDEVLSIALQTDNRMVLGGLFTRCSGVTRNAITRLNPDGTVDPTINFGPGADGFVGAVVVQESTIVGYPTNVPDEKIVIGGGFTHYFGEAHSHLARIYGGSLSGSGAFEFSAADYSVDENGLHVTITVDRTGGTSGTNGDGSGNVTVTFATSDDTAKSGVNYIGLTNDLVFAPGEVQENVVVTVLDDQVVTDDLTADLSLTPGPGAAYGDQPTAVLTIVNVDSAISFSSPTYLAPKYGTNVPNGFAPISVSRIGAIYGTSTVVFNTLTNGTAVAGVDYQPQTNVLVTFAPGVTNQQVNVPVINGVSDGNTTVGLQLTNVTGSVLYDPSNAVLTILDQTLAKGSFLFSSSNYVVSAGAGAGQTLATITVLRTNGASGIVSITYSTTNGTALAGVQYVATAGSLTFGDGVMSQTFTVPVYNTSVANVALNLSLLLSNPTGGAGVMSPTNATLTILNTNTGFYFAAATNNAPENAGFVSLTVLRNNTNGQAAVDFYTADGTGTNAAVNGTNYVGQAGTLVFVNGQLSTNIIVPLIYNPLVTGDLVFTVGLTNPNQAQLIAPSNAVVVVQDADAGISFTNAAMSVLKNGTNAVVAVVCSNPRVEPVSVSYFTADGTATNGIDYTATNGTLVFTNGVTTNYVTVPILNNQLLEGNVNFTVVLTNATYPGQLVSPSTNTVTIIDSNPGISFSSPVYAVAKTGVQALINVYRTGYTNSAASVNFATANGTASAGSDYVATNGTLVFTNGVTNLTFAVTVVNKLGVQPPKTVLLSLSSPTNAIMLAPTNAVLSILNDTNTAFAFALATNTVPENAGFVALTVTRFNNPVGTVSVAFGTTNGTAVAGLNYTATNSVLTFTNGQMSQTIIVPLIYDPLVTGDLAFTVGLSSPSVGQLIAPSVTTVIVQDADAGVSFTNAATTVLKNGTNAVLAVVCSNPRVEPVSVGYFTADGTATNGIDYTGTNGTLVFAGGVTTNFITVPILNNQLLEGNVNFTVVLTNAAYPGQLVSPTTNTVTIIDSNPGISFSSAVYSADKTSVQAVISVNRTGYTNSVMSVNFATANGTAASGSDYVATNGTLVFTNGVTSQTFTVTLINHLLVQPPKTVLLSLLNATNAIMVAPTNAVLTITDTNAGVIFASASYSFIETTPVATINVLRYNNTSGTNTVNWSTTNGPAVPGIGAALAGINYSAIVNQPLTFYPGVTNLTVFVPLLYNTNATGPVQLTAGLASSSPGVVVGTPGATVIVLQDADAGLSFSTNAGTVMKNAGSITITVICSNTNVEPVSVNYSTTNGTATAGTDYTATSGTLTFSNGVSSLSFPVPITNNGLITSNRVFYVNLSNPTGTGRLLPGPSQEAVTIIDSNSGLKFSSATYTVLKTNGPAVITVYRTDNTNTTSTVNYAATNGTAVNGVNFVATAGTLVFTNGVTSQTFTVPIIPTLTVQPDLTVVLTLSAPVNGTLLIPSAATLTIRDNTGSYVIPAGSQLLSETGAGAPNGLIDSNETVQVLFAFRDASARAVNSLVATLLATNGVTSPSPASQTYGPLTSYGHSVSMPFTFTAHGSNSQQIAATFQLQDGTTNIGTNVFGFTLGTATSVFSNNAVIVINDNAAASPYPSVINVSGVGGSLVKATVTLNKFAHTDPHDVSALVTAPAGTNTLIMSHTGGNGFGVTNLVLTFDDAATNSLPSSGAITSGTNRPTRYTPPNSFP